MAYLNLSKQINQTLFFFYFILSSFLLTSSLSLNTLKTNIRTNETPVLTKEDSAQPEVCEQGLEEAHYPNGKETFDMRFESIIIFSIITITLIIFRLVIKYLSSISTYFINKTIRVIIRYTTYYLSVIGLCVVLYSAGAFDEIKFNIENLLLGLFLFFILFLLYTSILTLCYSNHIDFLHSLDNNPSFASFKTVKSLYEKLINIQYSTKSKESKSQIDEIYKIYEYLSMKLFFIVPFFPVFKPSTLRQDFKFGLYLQKCLSKQIKIFYSFTWTSLILTIIFVLIWSTLILPSVINDLFMIFFPLLISIILLIINYYLNIVYRRVIPEINDINYLDYQDIDQPNQSSIFNNLTNFPLYLEKVYDGNGKVNTAIISHNDTLNDNNNINHSFDSKNYSIKTHFHLKTESFYDENILFGKTGFVLFGNLIQFFNIIFFIWLVTMITKYVKIFSEESDSFKIVLFFIATVVYIIILFYTTYSSIRQLSILTSCEMNKKKEIINKTLKAQMVTSAEMSNKIILNFRKIYFDIKINQNDEKSFNSLNRVSIKQLMDVNLMRYFNIEKDLDNNSYVNLEDIKKFAISCGNKLNNEEIENMLYYIENTQGLKEHKALNKRDFYDIIGANMNFSKESNINILYYVFNSYFQNRKLTENSFTQDELKQFFNFYREYFTKWQVDFVLKEASLIKNISIDSFIMILLSLSKYYAY